MGMSITLIIIIATVLVSIGAFNNQRLMDDLIFYPPAITERKQWYRFFTSGFIHADWAHLILNMYVLYLFGAGRYNTGVEFVFKTVFGQSGGWLYLLMYLLALLLCLLPTFSKYKDSYHYRSLGASGAVSAVVFAMIMFFPTMPMGIIFLPIYMPGFLFGLLYLVLSSWLDKRGDSNINHSAHIWGAIAGIGFVIIAGRFFSVPVLENFWYQVSHIDPSKLFTFGRP